LDIDILTSLSKRGQATQADIIRELLPKTGESYALTRVRTLEARGLILKEKKDQTNTRYLTITQAGREALTNLTSQEVLS
jgi:DNA-binding MarR family transcriptional regulator